MGLVSWGAPASGIADIAEATVGGFRLFVLGDPEAESWARIDLAGANVFTGKGRKSVRRAKQDAERWMVGLIDGLVPDLADSMREAGYAVGFRAAVREGVLRQAMADARQAIGRADRIGEYPVRPFVDAEGRARGADGRWVPLTTEMGPTNGTSVHLYARANIAGFGDVKFAAPVAVEQLAALVDLGLNRDELAERGVWTTRDGSRMLPQSMTTKHLLNLFWYLNGGGTIEYDKFWPWLKAEMVRRGLGAVIVDQLGETAVGGAS